MNRCNLVFFISLLLMQCAKPLALPEILQKIYPTQSENGYNIPKSESDLIASSGGNSTYGEITPEGVHRLIQELGIYPNDVFFDLGSGLGKMVIQMYLETPVKKSIGIELSSQRFRLAEQAKDLLRAQGHYDRKRELRFSNSNILNVPLDEATIIFTNSLCFSDEFMQKLLKQMSRLPKLHTVISTKQFPENPYLILSKQLLLPMSWSQQSPVYIYRLEKSSR